MASAWRRSDHGRHQLDRLRRADYLPWRKPVFVDIRPEKSWCIDAAGSKAAITPATKAILAVHLYGNLCDMDHLLAIGEKHGIPVIEDAAEAIGSVYFGDVQVAWAPSELSPFTAPRPSQPARAACS